MEKIKSSENSFQIFAAGSWQVPSESVPQGGPVPWWERVHPRRYAVDGRLNCFRSAGRTVGRDTRKEASGPSPGLRVSPAARLLLPGRVRWVAGKWRRGSVRRVLGQPAAGGRSQATESGSPARSRRPLQYGVIPPAGVRVGLLIPKTTD
jgi:hypothetical protein